MHQQNICEDNQNSSTDVHNIFAELSKILNNLETKYTNLEEQFKKSSEENFLLKLKNSALLIINEKNKNIEIELKQTSKKLEEQTANYNRLLEENSKIAALNDEINNLKLKSTQLSLENDELRDKNEKVTLENSSLKMKQDETDKTTAMLDQNVSTVEQKLKYVTAELEKEMAECTQLIAENQKFKSLNEAKESKSEHMKENIKIEQLEEHLDRVSSELEREIAKNTALTQYNKQLDGLIRGFRSKTQLEKVTSGSMESLTKSQEQLNDRNNYKVLIRDIPTDQILEPVENTVIVLASKMSMCINREDLIKVRIMERKGLREFSQNVSLLVEFKTSDTKTKFLSSRSKLKLNSSTKFIQLKEFVENEIYSLFLYANKKLRANGFNRIWYKDDKVFAKKNGSDTETIEIKSENHVDGLIKPN
ncbi:coiled-coil domain-containing protein 89-like [Calliphora vicina]|uniref:coiled-coil domain-containing protein 89-like n=1 Tax=Calliphora vicina TaxID=7373 RepID=UPI00325C1471